MFKCTPKCATNTRVSLAQRFQNWKDDNSGAVTVDWVVLTATLTVLGGVIVGLTVDGTTDVGEQIGTVLTDIPVTEN